ncbi:MAG: hypothetical protein H7Y38_09220 [Armatimonadetes bacterium]|nr:hypothetical protein [Armatimonadota bacterium]
MRIVLKPMGLTVIIGAITLLVLAALWKRPPVPAVTAPPVVPVAVQFAPARSGSATPNLVVYSDKLDNGWQERGWAKVVDYANAAPVRGKAGTSIRTEAAPYEAVKIYHPTVNMSPYKYVVLFVNGGEKGGQTLQLCFVAGGKTQKPVGVAPLPANKWVRVAVPLSDFGIAGRGDINAFWIQNQSGEPTTFYADDISFHQAAPDAVPEETIVATPVMAANAAP